MGRRFESYWNHHLKPESKLWQLGKKNITDVHWTRLESWAMPGVPDVYGIQDGISVFLELKVTKSNSIAFSPHQIAFHVKHPEHTWIIVQPHDQRDVILCPGSMVRELAACGLRACDSAPVPLRSLERLLLGA